MIGGLLQRVPLVGKHLELKIGAAEIREGIKSTASISVGLILYKALVHYGIWPLPFLADAEAVAASSAAVEYVRRTFFKQGRDVRD